MSTPKTYIVIPTYNEKNTITNIVKAIHALNIEKLHMLIVDDNSPDGTGAKADELSANYSNVSVLHREKKMGLGPAYIDGFKQALAEGADYIFGIDADLSHDPTRIPAFLDAIKDNDLVLGSRYIKDGGIKNWSIIRRFISYFGNIYARLVLSLPIKDLTGGYKCYRRKVLEKINVDDLSSMGYVFQIETTYKAVKAGFKIKEIPIIFTERTEGESKFNVKIFIGAFFKVLMLRFKK